MKTLIVMVETRDPVNEDVDTAPFYSLASVINLSYAKRHGYDFQFFFMDPGGSVQQPGPSPDSATASPQIGLRSRMCFECDVWVMRALQMLSSFLKPDHLERQTRVTLRYSTIREILFPHSTNNAAVPEHNAGAACKHVLWGARAPAWGKLLALREGLSLDYDQVVYIDSDAIFAAPHKSIEAFLTAFRPRGSEEPTLTVLSNFPWMNVEANAGFMVWNNSDRAKQLLEAWWNVDAGKYNLDRQWEQHGLNAHLLSDSESEYRRHVAVLPAVSLLEKKGQFVRHVTAPHGWERVPRMRLGLRQSKIDAERYSELVNELDRKHRRRLDTSIAS